MGWGILAAVFAGMSLYLILNPTRTGVVPNYRFASTVADRHYIVEHGMVVDEMSNEDLKASPDGVRKWLGV